MADDYRNPLGDEIDTRHVLARMLADQQAEERWPIRALRSLASYLPTDDRESNKRGPDEPWANWWMRTNLDSGGATALSGMLKGALGTTANWLAGKPEIGPDTLAPFGAAAMGIPFTRAMPHSTPRLPKEWAPEFVGPHRANDPWSRNPGIVRETSQLDDAISRAEATSAQRANLLADPGLLATAGEQGKPRIDNPIRAYHGSPSDFTEFSMDKIGTGTGVQGYGPGLSFAENPKVAETYRVWGDQPHPAQHFVDYALAESKGNLKIARELLARERANVPQEAHNIYLARQMIEGKPVSPELGHMYEVNLHAPENAWLDWDKPLSGQPEGVRAAIERAKATGDFSSDPTRWRPHSEMDAIALRQQGIPGAIYDAGLKGEPSRNFTVWSPEIIEILRKYGLIGPALLGPALANTLAGDQEQQQ